MTDKVWGPLVNLDLVKVMQRQVKFATYLRNRGYPTSPVTGRWCEAFTDECFSYYNQTHTAIEEPVTIKKITE